MASSGLTGRFWVCPECKRHVPVRSAQCQCGAERAAQPAGVVQVSPRAETTAQETGGGSLSVGLGLAALLVVGLGIALTHNRQSRVSTVTTGPSSASSNRPLRTSTGILEASYARDAGTLQASELLARAAGVSMVVEANQPGGRVQGSGVLVAPDRVVTNKHLVDGSSSTAVRAGPEYVRVEGTYVHPEYDLALITVQPRPEAVPVVRTARSLQPGEPVFLIACPEGGEPSISEGTLKSLRPFRDYALIESTVTLSAGETGGGLFDGQGRLIGITTDAIHEGTASLAIPVDIVVAAGSPPPRIAEPPPQIAQPVVATPSAGTDVHSPTPPNESAIETARRLGTQEFEERVAAMRKKADAADIAWERFRAGCREIVTELSSCASAAGVQAVAAGDRGWFVVGVAATSALACSSARRAEWTAACADAGTFFALTGQINAEMCTAEEHARKSHVLPGTRREIRSRYLLEWSGWDRVCP